MPGPRMCSVWRCNVSKLLVSSPALSASPVSKSFLTHAYTALSRGACGQLARNFSSVAKRPRPSAFYSPDPPALAGRLGVMDVPADGNNVSIAQESLLKEIEQELGSSLGTRPQAPIQKPLVLVISGPSGVGKDAVVNRLKEVRNEIHFVVTATTRAKRPGEIDGKDYFFLTKQEFEFMIQKNELLEYAIVYGDFKGIPKQQVRDCLEKGFDVVLRVDVQGAATVRSILGSSAVFIFLVAESEAALVTRLAERKTETKDKLLLRIATSREELKRIKEFDYVVVNADGQLERTVSLISHIIDAEKARVHQRHANL